MVGEKTEKRETGASNSDRRTFLRGAVGAGVASGVGVGSAGATTADDDVLAWQYDAPGRVSSSPLLVDGTIYIPGDDSSLYAVDAASGEQQWCFDTLEDPDRPVVVDDTVYAAATYVYAVDAATGDEQWRFETPDRGSDGSVEQFSAWALAVKDGTVYTSGQFGDLFALDAASGELQWRFELDASVRSLAVVDETAYLVGFSDVYAVDVASREKQWHIKQESALRVEGVVDGIVYLKSDDTNLYALDAASGDELWRFDAGDWVDSSAVIMDGTVYVGGDDLYAVDAASGQQEWAFETAARSHESLTVADGTVYIGDGHALVAVDAATGEQEWRFLADMWVNWIPAVVDDVVYIVGRKMYAVDTASVEDNLLYTVDDGYVYAMEEDEVKYRIVRPLRSTLVFLGLLGLGGSGTVWLARRLGNALEGDDQGGESYDPEPRRQ